RELSTGKNQDVPDLNHTNRLTRDKAHCLLFFRGDNAYIFSSSHNYRLKALYSHTIGRHTKLVKSNSIPILENLGTHHLPNRSEHTREQFQALGLPPFEIVAYHGVISQTNVPHQSYIEQKAPSDVAAPANPISPDADNR